MGPLFEKFFRKIEATETTFLRSAMDRIHWEARLIGIKGARGVGKTTLMLQYIKMHLPLDGATLYVSLDNIWFAKNSLYDLADEFVKKGGRHLFLDEVHKYPNWSQEIKNIYDDYPELQTVFTGSSMLEILNASADLSRRAIIYQMQGLSFREYLNLKLGKDLPIFKLKDLLDNHSELARGILKDIKPLQHFDDYLNNGYYPFFQEVPDLYHQRIEEVVNMSLEIELPLLRKVDIAYIPKLKQLLQIISESVPFIPNVTKLSQRIGINRNTFISYLFFLQEAHLTRNLYKDVRGITQLQKPDKIFLENTNFQFAFAPENADQGNLRETFFLNQVNYFHEVEYMDKGDFMVDRKFTFEIGGKSKTTEQIKNSKSGFVAADGIEYGIGNKIPLWLFGFMY
ncbi:ATP-binding protein [Litoribacter alkaliphilus]|uniref:ATP-binding protein n=1 Tax=Litoribacter ruber TaxID=702568 RepID=A0AAP2G350_9BACT|nr:AAA family ATPase [Litoribacter alkaliphilus]MBS9523085.1 ATP-binding protein [Litoribacter alkaliphilus]